MVEYTHELRIPKERVAVLIGTKGESKKELEQLTSTKISVDSEEGFVTISGEDPIILLSLKEIVKAIGRGFSPESARLLIKPDFCFELIILADFAKTKKDSIRLKGRVIGKEGKSRKVIEDMCDVYISVFGKTIGIIGEAQKVSIARRAIKSLLSGSPHANVYKWLEKQRRQLTKLELLGSSLLKE